MIKIHLLSHNREQSGSNTKAVNAASVSSKIRICSAFNGQRGGRSRGAKLRRELCESRGGHPGLPVPNKPDGFCGRKVTPKRKRGKWWGGGGGGEGGKASGGGGCRGGVSDVFIQSVLRAVQCEGDGHASSNLETRFAGPGPIHHNPSNGSVAGLLDAASTTPF